jgi:hypothetical protein
MCAGIIVEIQSAFNFESAPKSLNLKIATKSQKHKTPQSAENQLNNFCGILCFWDFVFLRFCGKNWLF